MRKMGRKSPSGVGSRSARCWGLCGSSRCMKKIVSDPAPAMCSPGVRSPAEKRPIGLAARKKPRVPYMVTDQNAVLLRV